MRLVFSDSVCVTVRPVAELRELGLSDILS